jgi:putative protein-disulfide isomerase
MNLIYVADPMCSWCYGFGRTISELLAEPGDLQPLQLALVMGGLRPYTTEPLTPARTEEILEHWQHVQEASGLPFVAAPHTALHEAGFTYDTEPASRATVTVRTLWPQHTWRYFKAVQAAFYGEGKNVTQATVLADVAEAVGLPRADFAKTFASTALREATAKDFAQSQAWGITGFPAVITQKGDALHLVCRGYTPVANLRAQITALLTSTTTD